MTEPSLHKIAKVARERGFSRRSPAYRWLRRRHTSLRKLLADHEPPWTALAEEMAAAGIVGGRNRPLTAHNVRRIWQRVCRDVESEAATRKPALRDRLPPPGWRPEPVPTATRQAPEAPALRREEPPSPSPDLAAREKLPPLRPPPSAAPQARSDEETRAEIERVMAELAASQKWMGSKRRPG